MQRFVSDLNAPVGSQLSQEQDNISVVITDNERRSCFSGNSQMESRDSLCVSKLFKVRLTARSRNRRRRAALAPALPFLVTTAVRNSPFISEDLPKFLFFHMRAGQLPHKRLIDPAARNVWERQTDVRQRAQHTSLTCLTCIDGVFRMWAVCR